MFKKLFSKKPTIEDLQINVENCEYEGIHKGVKVWRTELGDAFGVYFIKMVPDVPSELSKAQGYYKKQIEESGGKLVELHIEKIEDIQSIRLIAKIPQAPSGMTYIHSITIPFKNFSYVIKGQFEEYGATGCREAVLFDKYPAPGLIDSFDNEEYDNEFPEHPLSRARATFKKDIKAISLSKILKSYASFY
ncbi:MAG: hypothetical protein F6J87_18205 [Spirulina sp. SIO3F2]|nr:hypothetical protein [Spirulina sp. SIO3F2]